MTIRRLALRVVLGLVLGLPGTAFLPAAAGAAEPAAKQPLADASFERAEGDLPAGWKTHTWGGKAAFEYAHSGRTGDRSVSIASDQGADASWFLQTPVRPFSRYRLSGWIKTENVKTQGGRGALFNLHNIQSARTPALTGTRDWTRVEMEFDTNEEDGIWVNCLFGGWGLATGKAWFDDLQLELLSTTSPEPSIVIDAAQRGEPIEKYIYGQFIEHLGRCIYGGIWAEMLGDRKFFLAVGAEGSPWQRLGGATVKMVAEDSFVGDATPRIHLPDGSAPNGLTPSGIAQAGLGIRKGKHYVGRIWLAGDGRAAPVRVSLVWGDRPDQRDTVTIKTLSADYAKTPLEFTAGADSDDARLEIASTGRVGFSVGTVSLMPADNVHGLRADTLELLKQLDAPVYRWPGGNFVSGYDWHDGLGDPDRRPPRKNPAWKGIEHNDFGIDEFITFCRILKTDPLVVVNTGLGSVEMATAELEYANGAADTPMGRLRAAHGHAEPYGVKFWGIGNEMYGRWQLGHVPLEEYTKRHNRFVDAMRAVDPSIRVIAVGAVGPWSEGMMAHCADHMDLISEHFYCGAKVGVLSHVAQIRDQVRLKARAHRRYRREIPALAGKNIRIALDEWNYWYGPELYGQVGPRYFLKDALGIAAGLNELARNSDLFYMANYAQTVNVIGAIKTSKTAAGFATTGLALKLYRHHFGSVPLATTSGGPLDAQAALSEDGRTLTLAVVNPTDQTLAVPLEIRGLPISGRGTLWQIADNDPMAYNNPGQTPHVVIHESAVSGVKDTLTLAPYSVSLFALKRR